MNPNFKIFLAKKYVKLLMQCASKKYKGNLLKIILTEHFWHLN